MSGIAPMLPRMGRREFKELRMIMLLIFIDKVRLEIKE
jgi:hypothetical protein